MFKHLMLFFFIACSTHQVERIPSSTPYQNSWQDYLTHNFLDRYGAEKYFKDSIYLGPWREDREFVMERSLPPHRIQEKPFACRVKKLYPTHPSQASKEYHHAVYSQYDHGRLPPNSYACLRKNPTNRFCVMAAIAKMVIMSDTYEDECGNLYRGYWLVTYLKSDESMGTLYAKGRSAFERPNSEFRGDYIEDGTYAVPMKDFFLLGELLPGDSAKIKAERTRAQRAGFRRNGKLFVR